MTSKPAVQPGEACTQVLRVEGMHCPNCAMRLEGLEDELAGVLQVRASYHKGRMEVTFDAGRVSLEAILAAMRRLGYDAREE